MFTDLETTFVGIITALAALFAFSIPAFSTLKNYAPMDAVKYYSS